MKTKLSFATRILEYYDDLIRYARYLCNGSSVESEDLVQDTYLRACQKKRSYNNEHDKLKYWLLKIMRRLFLDCLRRNTKLGIGQHLEIKEYRYPNNEDVDSIFFEFERQEVMEALESIDSLESQILRLRYLGYKFAEISDVCSISAGEARLKAYRARKKMTQKNSEILESLRMT